MTTMTTDTMTADEAQRLLDGATPGEWGAYRPSEYPKDFRLASLQGAPVRYVGRLTCSHPNEPHPTKGDAALCAAAPRLAASVVALHARLAQVTAERDALRTLAVDLVPRCDFGVCDAPATHESPGVLRTEWACDVHRCAIRHPEETEHADVIRTLPRGR